MAYGKLKLHHDVPLYVKAQLVESSKKSKLTATEFLSRAIKEEYNKTFPNKLIDNQNI